MAVPLVVRKTLRRFGLLKAAQSVKYAVSGTPKYHDFKPADPRTLIATLTCFEWLRARNLLEGSDYCEFGIFRGFNMWFMQGLARAHNLADLRFIGFDSFFGLPAGEGTFQEGEFSAYREEVESYFNRYGVDWSRTTLVEGFFAKSLTDETAKRIGLRRCTYCVVDCDLYASTVPVLRFIADYLAPTSVIYFDDWNDFKNVAEMAGEPKAFAEFLEEHGGTFTAESLPDLIERGGKGKAFVLRRK